MRHRIWICIVCGERLTKLLRSTCVCLGLICDSFTNQIIFYFFFCRRIPTSQLTILQDLKQFKVVNLCLQGFEDWSCGHWRTYLSWRDIGSPWINFVAQTVIQLWSRLRGRSSSLQFHCSSFWSLIVKDNCDFLFASEWQFVYKLMIVSKTLLTIKGPRGWPNLGLGGGHFTFFNNLRAAEYRVHLNNLR
jgi:hypothetical protein